MEEVLYENVRLEKDRAYFLYVGEIKGHGLNHFLKEPLERVHGRPVDFISIIPDVLSEYRHGNLVVINPEAGRLRRETGLTHSVRIPAGRFAEEVGTSPFVAGLIRRILGSQDRLYLNMWASQVEMTLTEDERVRLIGPDPELALELNNKLKQYRLAGELGVSVPPGGTCGSVEEALALAEEYFRRGEQFFVTAEYSAAGSNSIVASTGDEIRERFGRGFGNLLVTRYIDHRYDPTVLGIVAGPEDVYIASVADQTMEGVRFRGSHYPTLLDRGKAAELKKITRIIGRRMGEMGYRGVFGCDYIIDGEGKIYFVEINARKQGTTLETSLTMLHHLPDQPTFPELEFLAVTEGSFPPGLREMDPSEASLCWGTYNCKMEEDVEVNGHIAPACSEMELFARAAADDGQGSSFIVEDHVGTPMRQKAGGFLARIIAASGDRSRVAEAVREGRRRVEKTFRPVPSDPRR